MASSVMIRIRSPGCTDRTGTWKLFITDINRVAGLPNRSIITMNYVLQ
jgi:hypothetical protein